MDTSTARQQFREAVAKVAERAKEKLPECNGRVEKAVALVLQGDVELGEGGNATVYSSTDPTRRYEVIDGSCTCRDWEQAPHHFCKHRLSAAIARRVQEMLPPAENCQTLTVSQVATPAPLPEAPVSITLKAMLYGHEVLVTLRGTDFASVKAQVEQASEWLRVQAPAQPTTQGTERPEGWCSKHGVQMHQNHKDGRAWWSHKTTDGWCKGK